MRDSENLDRNKLESKTNEGSQGFVSVNQVGYIPGQSKVAVFPRAENNPNQLTFRIYDIHSQNVVFQGVAKPSFYDRASGDHVHLLDFTEFNVPGTYKIDVDDAVSVPFDIRSGIYETLTVDAVKFFYHNRVGIPIEIQYVGQTQWTRPAGHVTDNEVTCFKGIDQHGVEWTGCDYTLDVSGGWYDAGDFGKYVVNGGITTWTLANIYEQNPTKLGDGTLNIPESGNGFPDILDEARWEMEWILRMQVPAGQPQAGMVHHKMHSVRWDPLPMIPPSELDNDIEHTSADRGRYLMPPSTAATLNLAATAAQCARIWADLDPQFAKRCLTSAEIAWNAAHNNPVFLYGDIPGIGGGPYDDDNVEDEFFWAAAELYVTTGASRYYEFLSSSVYFDKLQDWSAGSEDAFRWSDTAMLGKITLATVDSNLRQSERDQFRSQIITVAKNYLEVTNSEGYRLPMGPNGYSWGSNSVVLNNAMLMAYAYMFTNDQSYLDAVVMAMDYVLGRNALNFSFVAGYGMHSMAHPHHRFWADRDVPPGALAGGPNAAPSDPAAEAPQIKERATAKRYIDDIGSWSTNEVAINWNAPLAWISAFVDEHTQ